MIQRRRREHSPQHRPSNLDTSNNITDLTSIGLTDSYREPKVYLCEFCDRVLIEKKDDITYLGPGNKRYICPSCGIISDLVNGEVSRIKAQERPHTIVGDNTLESTIIPQVEVIPNSSNVKDKTKGTLFMRDTDDIDSLDPEPREDETLRSQGFKILKKTIKRADGRSISVTYDE